ncbi:hypothetical protein [Lentzea albidocapillata]|uniref:Uncharacterized protein n=1 Tax=Lentzea albidocapillata TaxID=40571 RepID=A0A1W2FRR4_9PSEU|nr:hypothetical protein [Lentzea albidocapillata]SMD24659.1 hypothetical protein SAMN05660733_07783 [Lentzea albidocapillata]
MGRLSRPQVIVLLVGAAQVASGLSGFPDIGEPHRILLLCTGLLGLACAWNSRHARLYGAGLAIWYSAIAYAGIEEDALVLHLRVVLVGLLAAVVPTGRGRTGVTRPLKGKAR